MQFTQYAGSILELDSLLESLESLAESCGVSSPEHDPWYALLKKKLVPQLNEKPFLLVALMGGTNTGKSLIFNHLAGGTFSAVDHRASGTKHPICLVPPCRSLQSRSLQGRSPQGTGISSFGTILARHFDTFQCVPWSNAEQPLEHSEENTLFWLEGASVPERLFLIDTPDFDADRETNWDRAKSIRHAADVVIAVLTEQKYNDAAVRAFFREAAGSGKPIIVLFNMIDLDHDQQHVARWLEQFQNETGTQPMDVFVAPYLRDAAENLSLSFYAFRNNTFVPVDLQSALSDLHFDTIKTQTLLGAMSVLDNPHTGLPSYLDTIQQASKLFADASKTLQNIGTAEVQWSCLPTSVLADEIRAWWNSNRPAWSQTINSVYHKVGSGLLWSVRKTAGYFMGKEKSVPAAAETLGDFFAAERRIVIELIEKVMKKLETLADTDNPVLRKEITAFMSGEHRALLLQRAYSVLESLPPIQQDFRQMLHRRLSDWASQHPKAAASMQVVDGVLTAAHPIITVTLALCGGLAAAPLVLQAAGGAAAAAAGEVAIQAGSDGVMGQVAKLFQQIQEDYVLARSQRFTEEFHKELWEDVLDRLQNGASATESDVYKRCRNWRRPE